MTISSSASGESKGIHRFLNLRISTLNPVFFKGQPESLFTEDMLKYIKISKHPLTKILESVNSFHKVAGYYICTCKYSIYLYIQISLVFLCTTTEQSEKEIKKTMPFIAVLKTVKCLGINSL